MTPTQIRSLQIVALLGAIAWGATIWWINGLPVEDLPRLGWTSKIPHFDKIVHFGLYGILAGFAWLALGLGCRPGGRVWVACGALIVVLVATAGAADEWRQRLVPGRAASLQDWLADFAGAIVAVVILSLMHCWLARRMTANTEVSSEKVSREVSTGLLATRPTSRDT